MSELITFINGQMMPHGQAVAKLNDGQVSSAGGFYDAERTFDGRVFKLRAHLERLYGSLEYAKIDPGMSLEEMESVTLEVAEANRSFLKPNDDFILSQVVTSIADSDGGGKPRVNVVIFSELIDFASFARGYDIGLRLITPITYAVPARVSADGVTQNLQQTLSLNTDAEGNVTECQHANFMFVKDGRIKLPNRRNVLPGISMQTVLEMAESLGEPIDEDDYNSLDVYECDEAFVSSTRFCLLPVATFNGLTLGRGNLPGPITTRLLKAWADTVEADFVGRALSHLPPEDTQVISIE